MTDSSSNDHEELAGMAAELISAKMEAARKAFQQRLWERERKQAGLDPTYPDRK